MKNKDIPYEDILIFMFKKLIDIYGVDTAIIMLYKINSLRGVKI